MADQENIVQDTPETTGATPEAPASAPTEAEAQAQTQAPAPAPTRETRPQRRASTPYRRRRRGKVCQFCVEGITKIDYKDVDLLKQYISESARIQSRRKTGTCAKHQRMLARAIKRARHVALLPYTAEHIRRYGG